jgi:hypothetical protein
VIFLTVNEDEDYVAAALDSRGVAYVLKSRMYSGLMQAIGGRNFYLSTDDFNLFPFSTSPDFK